MHCHVCGPILVVTTEVCFIPGALGNATRICWYACVRLELMERCKLAHGDRALGVVVGLKTRHADFGIAMSMCNRNHWILFHDNCGFQSLCACAALVVKPTYTNSGWRARLLSYCVRIHSWHPAVALRYCARFARRDSTCLEGLAGRVAFASKYLSCLRGASDPRGEK